MPLYPTAVSRRRAGYFQRPARPQARSRASRASEAFAPPVVAAASLEKQMAKALATRAAPLTLRGIGLVIPLVGYAVFAWAVWSLVKGSAIFTGPGGAPVAGIPGNYVRDDTPDPWTAFPNNGLGAADDRANSGANFISLDPTVYDAPPWNNPSDFGTFRQRTFFAVPQGEWWPTPHYTRTSDQPGQVVYPGFYIPTGGGVIFDIPSDDIEVPNLRDVFPQVHVLAPFGDGAPGMALARELRNSRYPQGFQTFAQPGGPQRPTEWMPGDDAVPPRRDLYVGWYLDDLDQYWRFDVLRRSTNVDSRLGTVRNMYYAAIIEEFRRDFEGPEDQGWWFAPGDWFKDAKYPSYVTDAPPGYGRIVLGSGPIPYDASPNVRLEAVAGGRGASVTTGHGGYKNTGPLGKREKEKKFTGSLHPRNVLLRSFNALSEANDAVDAVYKAIPKELRKKQPRTLQNKIRLIWKHTDRIDYEQALKNLYIENVKDFYYGQIGKAGARAQQNLHRLGYPASGPTLTTRTGHTGAGRLPEINFPF